MSGINKAGEGTRRGHGSAVSVGVARLPRMVWLLSFTVLVCLVAWWHADSRQEKSPLSESPAVHPASASVELAMREVHWREPVYAARTETRLHRANFRLEAEFSRLAVDADGGDRFASCLLSRGLALCEEMEKLHAEERHWTEIAVRSKKNSSEESFAVMRIHAHGDSVIEAAAVCEGLAPGRLDESASRMLQAAKLGDPHAMAHFALYSRRPEGETQMRKSYDKAYRENAIVMLERSASLGNLRAMRSLYEVYLHGVSPNRSDSMRVERDPSSAIAIGMVLIQKVGPAEKEYIAATMGRIKERASVIGSGRYLLQLRKYSKYMDAISMRGFDESGRNMDISSCQDYR